MFFNTGNSVNLLAIVSYYNYNHVMRNIIINTEAQRHRGTCIKGELCTHILFMHKFNYTCV